MTTYSEIKEGVRQRHGRSVKDCWIAHVKELNELPLRQAPNRPPGSQRKNPCPDWARPMIEDSMHLFGMM